MSIALPGVQERRESKVIPRAKPLHEYVNLYICARNPMMYLWRSRHEALCVLQIKPAVVSLPGVVVADGNAASGPTAFWQSPSGLSKVDKDTVFAEWWTDPDPFVLWENRRVKCAEVLVPDKVDTRFITGAYVSCAAAESDLRTIAPGISITVDPHMFLRHKETTNGQSPDRKSFRFQAPNNCKHRKLCRRYGQGCGPRVQEAFSGDVRGLREAMSAP